MNIQPTALLLISLAFGLAGNSALAQDANPYDVMGETLFAQTSTTELD